MLVEKIKSGVDNISKQLDAKVNCIYIHPDHTEALIKELGILPTSLFGARVVMPTLDDLEMMKSIFNCSQTDLWDPDKIYFTTEIARSILQLGSTD